MLEKCLLCYTEVFLSVQWVASKSPVIVVLCDAAILHIRFDKKAESKPSLLDARYTIPLFRNPFSFHDLKIVRL